MTYDYWRLHTDLQQRRTIRLLSSMVMLCIPTLLTRDAQTAKTT